MWGISREADYAVRVMVHLATVGSARCQAETLAREEHIPKSFLFKILQLLVRRRWVRSFRGVGGGYQLAVPPEQITLYEVLELVEGPIGLNACVICGGGCEMRARCGVHDVWAELQAQLRQVLENATIEELAHRTLQKRRRVVAPEPTVAVLPPAPGAASADGGSASAAASGSPH